MDHLTALERSKNMAGVRGKHTQTEKRVRSRLHGAGYRFSLHRTDLPGKPDIVLRKYRTVVFVHGCFWHGHSCRKGARPKTNRKFWNAKLNRNMERDAANIAALKERGWSVWIVWECEWEPGTDRIIAALKRAKSKA